MALYQKVPEQSIISFLDNFESFLSYTQKSVLRLFPIKKKKDPSTSYWCCQIFVYLFFKVIFFKKFFLDLFIYS